MTANKHWSEYLLPVPTTVSLISMLMLISAQFSTVITLQKPSSGHWEYLKYDTLVPNIHKLKNNMIETFESSDEAMMRINYYSKEINDQLKSALKYSSLPQNTQDEIKTKKLLLEKCMQLMGKWAQENVLKANETIQQLDTISKFTGISGSAWCVWFSLSIKSSTLS